MHQFLAPPLHPPAPRLPPHTKSPRTPVPQVWDNERVVLIPDHYIFTSDPRANRNVDILR